MTAGVEPLLRDRDAARALDVVGEVAAALAAPLPAGAGWSLCRGTAGVALFLAEAALALGDDRLADVAAERLDDAVAAAADAPPSTSLYAGTVGAGWLLAHLDGRLVDAARAADDVDDLVLRTLEAHGPVADLTDGLAGVGVYLLARLPRPAAREGLDRVVALLAAAQDDGAWPARPEWMPPAERERFPAGYLSLGMAHGLAGVVALLARLHAAGVAGARPVLDRAVAALVAFRHPEDDAIGRYPGVVPADGLRGSRVAWCYGDPGVAVGLLAAARALGDAGVEAEALATARAAAARPRAGSMNVDAGLCHGSAGLVHVFGRLAAATGGEACAAAARRWLDVLLEQRVPGAPFAGFQAVFDVAEGPVPAAGYLEGAAGAGLALLTAAVPVASPWDAPLLTDLAMGDGGATGAAPPS